MGEQARCEYSDQVNDGSLVRCPNPGRQVMSWTDEGLEEETICAAHERMRYGCQECGDVKANWRVPLCERCRQEQQAQEKGGEAIA